MTPGAPDLRSLLTGRPPGGGVLLAVLFASALIGPSCVSVDPAAWADGEVRELDSNRPVPGALVYIDPSARGASLASRNWTNEAGHFAVYQAVERGQRTVPLVVVAEGFKPAEFPLPTLQSNPLRVRLAAAGSPSESRIEQLPASPEDGDGHDGSCGSD
jgi:hypothetical protein